MPEISQERMVIPTEPFDDSTLEPFVLSQCLEHRMYPSVESKLNRWTLEHHTYLTANVRRTEQTPGGDVFVIATPGSGQTVVNLIIRSLGINTEPMGGGVGGGPTDYDLAIIMIRDIRDCICAHAKRHYSERPDALEAAIHDFRAWDYCAKSINAARSENSVLIYYEEFLPEDLRGLIERLIQELALEVSDEFIEYLVWEFSLDRMKARASKLSSFEEHDKYYIHGKHITNDGQSGAWKLRFTDDIQDKIKPYFGDWLTTFGYERTTE